MADFVMCFLATGRAKKGYSCGRSRSCGGVDHGYITAITRGPFSEPYVMVDLVRCGVSPCSLLALHRANEGGFKKINFGALPFSSGARPFFLRDGFCRFNITINQQT